MKKTEETRLWDVINRGLDLLGAQFLLLILAAVFGNQFSGFVFH